MNRKPLLTTLLIGAAILFWSCFTVANPSGGVDIYSGFYSREGNDSIAAKVAGNSIYIKFYPDKWVVMLYIPYPYSLELEPDTIEKVFAAVERKSSAYIKSEFGVLKKKATVHIERFEMTKENEARFECDGMAPCQAVFDGDTMDMVKAGIISNHIIRFERVK